AGVSNIAGVHVLLIEDDDDSRRLLAMMLKRHGAKVTPASTSAEALRAFSRVESGPASLVAESPPGGERETANLADVSGKGHGRDKRPGHGQAVQPGSNDGSSAKHRLPDLIISDIGMPEVDGYELLRSVRKLPAEQGGLVPAIALTGYATRKDREQALAAGYQLHLAKPVEPADLIAAISRLVGPREGSK
ncbi:MAG: response regulator, partial [Pyrinomonadaceae bacterium]